MASLVGANGARSIVPTSRDATPPPVRLRANSLVRIAQTEQRKGNEMIGAELGSATSDSPLSANIPGGPEHRFGEYHTTTWPGARLPQCLA